MVDSLLLVVLLVVLACCRHGEASVLAQPEVHHGVAEAAVVRSERAFAGHAADDVERLGKPGLEAAAAAPNLFRREAARPPPATVAAAAALVAAAQWAAPPEVSQVAAVAVDPPAAAPAAAAARAAPTTDWPGVLNVAWLTTSSLAFLVPAIYAHLNGMMWFTILFTAQALVSWAYQFCDAGAPQVLLGYEAGCFHPLSTALRHLGPGLAYYLCLQIALAFLGPEDPALQHINRNAEAHFGDQARRRDMTLANKDLSERMGLPWLAAAAGPHVPQDVIMFSRAVPGITMLGFLQTYSSWDNFHWECMIWYATMLLLSVWSFWMQRREFATSVLLRLGFWRRVVQCMLLPLALVGSTFGLLEHTGDPAWMHGMWFVVVSALAVFEIWRVLLGDSVTFTYDDPARNPIVAHYIFLAVPVLGVATIVLALVLDSAANSAQGDRWSWPSISLAMTRAPGEYIFMLGTMCTAAAAAATWRLIDMICAYHEDACQRDGELHKPGRSIDKWVIQSGGGCKDAHKAACSSPKSRESSGHLLPLRQAGPVLGSIAVLLAFIGACNRGELRVNFLIAFLTWEAIAIVFNTMSAFRYGVPNHARVLVAGILIVNTMGFLCTFQDSALIPDSMGVYREAIYNCHGAAMIGLYFAWPLTWISEAQAVMPLLVQWHRVSS